ncbi:hypothetical protein Tco_0920350 [Tanacetum coccineum]
MLKSSFSEFVRDDESAGLGLDHGTKGFSSDRIKLLMSMVTLLLLVIRLQQLVPVENKRIIRKTPSSYANKLIPTSSTKANLWKLEANVPNGTDYDVWLPLASGEPPHCCTCLIFGYSPVDCPKAPKATKVAPIRVVNQKDKGKGQTSGADDEGFIKVKKKKLGGNNGSTKNFTFSVKPKTLYRPKAKQSTNGTSNSPKTNPFVGMNKASTSCYNKDSSSNKDKINVLEKQILEGKLVLVDDDGKPLEKVDYSVNLGSDDEVELVENKIKSFLASKPTGELVMVRKSCWNNGGKSNVDDDYNPYDVDRYEGQAILDNIQNICDNLDIKVRIRKKK